MSESAPIITVQVECPKCSAMFDTEVYAVIRPDEEIERLTAENKKLRAVLKYPRFDNTANLLREAQKNIDKLVSNSDPRMTSYLSPHLSRAADLIDTALKGE